MMLKGTKHLIETIRENGGLTFDPKSFIKVEKGYSVSIQDLYMLDKDTTSRLLYAPTIEDYQKLDKLIDEAFDLGHMLGFWINDERLYIDWIDVVDNEQKAVMIGKENNQLAIYDLTNKKEIFLK